MTRDEIPELHFITPIANVPPIMKHGILCHKRTGQIEHHSVAMAEIQERRTNKRIPGAGTLHNYANLYFDAHNPIGSQWLSYLTPFNHALFIALQGHLHANRLPGVMKTKDKNGKLINFGSLLDADKPFASHYPIIAEGLQDANSRRNKLPASHPYEVIGGARARHLGKHEQASLTEKLSKAYQEILSLLSSP